MKTARAALAILVSAILWPGFAQADNGFIFRYKAEIVDNATDGPGDPTNNENGICEPGETGMPDCNDVCDAGEEGSADCPTAENPGDEERLIDTVDATVDYGDYDSGTDSESPSALTVVPGDSGRNVGSDGMVYQCFKTSGGWGNYSFTPLEFNPSRNWIEDYDVVLGSNLHGPISTRSQAELWMGRLFAPAFDDASYSARVTNADVACIRIKVKPGIKSTKPATILFVVLDYNTSKVAGGKVDWDNPSDNFVAFPVTFSPNCDGGCFNDVPPLQLTASGGNVDLHSLTYMGFGWGYAPGDSFHPTQTSATVSGGLPPYEFEASSDSANNFSGKPVGTGCMLRFDSYSIPPEFYPADQSETFTANFKVTDAAGQVATISVSHSINGMNDYGDGKAYPGGFTDELDPASNCGYQPMVVTQDETSMEFQEDDQGTLPMWAYGGSGNFIITIENLPPELEFIQQYGSGRLRATAPGSWEGANAIKVKVEDSDGNVEHLSFDVVVTPKPSDMAAFGSNSYGAFGVYPGNTSQEVRPYGVSLQGYSFLSAGLDYTCGLTGGDLYCWGYNGKMQAGSTATGYPYYVGPTQIGGSGWTSIDAGTGGHACGVQNGTLYCWGDGSTGALGNGSMSMTTNVPQPVSGGMAWSAYSVGNFNSCGVSQGGLYCWGSGYNGLLGLGSDMGDKAVPTQVGNLTNWTSVSASGSHACAINSAGEMYCWGNNVPGGTGLGTNSSVTSVPTAIDSSVVPNSGWTKVLTGNGFTCGMKGSDAYCWGSNSYGQLGVGGTTSTNKPTQQTAVGGWDSLDVAASSACGLKGTDAYCWGDNTNGRTGQATPYNSTNVPTKVAPDGWGTEYQWLSISAGEKHSIGIVK